jgi:dihydroorotate dehydrogenase
MLLPVETHTPLWNAAGTLGFALPKRSPFAAGLGAFVTNPISWGPRTPAHSPRLLAYPGGVLLHTGLPNPGFRQGLRQYARHWARADLPVIVHLLAETPETLSRMVQQLEEVDGVAGIELGLPPDVDAATLAEMIEAATGELPLIVRLAPESVFPPVLPNGVSLGPPRGSLPGAGTGAFVQGRLFGAGVFPLALHTVRAWHAAWGEAGVPIIAGGGVYHPAQAQAMLAAGASAVQLDLRLWREPWPDEAWINWLATVPSKSSLAHR